MNDQAVHTAEAEHSVPATDALESLRIALAEINARLFKLEAQSEPTLADTLPDLLPESCCMLLDYLMGKDHGTDQKLLECPTDSHCGEAITALVRAAIPLLSIISAFPPAAEKVYEAVYDEACTIYFG